MYFRINFVILFEKIKIKVTLPLTSNAHGRQAHFLYAASTISFLLLVRSFVLKKIDIKNLSIEVTHV